MITITDIAERILNGNSFTMTSRLQSVYDGAVIAEDIPALGVVEESDESLTVPERLTFQVPAEDDHGNLWVPLAYDAPLGTYGQRIVAQIGVSVGNERTEWINRGMFLIQSVQTQGHQLSVECTGMMRLVDEADLATEYQPHAGATLKSILRAMLEPGLTVSVSSSLTDRTAPTSITWSDSRIDNAYAVLDAWPAKGYVTPAGDFAVVPVPGVPTLANSVFSFSDGRRGTVESISSSITREGAFNAVVAKGQTPDDDGTGAAGQEIISTVFDNVATSPYRAGGPFSPYTVPFGYASPLMTTLAMTQQAAATRLATKRAEAARTITLTAVPNPALQLGDPVDVTSRRLGLQQAPGRIGSITLPHQAEGGAMTVTIRLAD